MKYYAYMFTTTDTFVTWTFIFASSDAENIYMKALNNALESRYFSEDCGITIWSINEIATSTPVSQLPQDVQQVIRYDLGIDVLTGTFENYSRHYNKNLFEDGSCKAVHQYINQIKGE